MPMKNNIAFLIFNILGLQITWAGCAYGATHGIPLLGVYIGLTYIVLHFIFINLRLRDFIIMLIIGALGIITDSAFTLLRVISFPTYENNLTPIPFWLISLWLVFALTVPHSLYWLRNNLLIASVAGAIGGSFSYFIGHTLGAIQLAEPLSMSMVIYFIAWGVIFPCALKIVAYFTPDNINITSATT
jgi:hypothetical protein